MSTGPSRNLETVPVALGDRSYDVLIGPGLLGRAPDLIKARLGGGTLPPFRYKHAGSLAQIGKKKAVIDFGWMKMRGNLAWWIWGLAHIYFLIGLRNRLSVALSWLWIHARDQRAARLITQGSSKVSG